MVSTLLYHSRIIDEKIMIRYFGSFRSNVVPSSLNKMSAIKVGSRDRL